MVAGVAKEGVPVRLLDVGTGGGLPGIPLACVMKDEMHLTMLESTGKKADFLRTATKELGLDGVEVIRDRAENAGQAQDHRARYDVVVSRAVGKLRVLLELTVPFCREQGLVLSIKGAQAQNEIDEAKQALHMLHATVVETVQTATGRIVIVEKGARPRLDIRGCLASRRNVHSETRRIHT